MSWRPGEAAVSGEESQKVGHTGKPPEGGAVILWCWFNGPASHFLCAVHRASLPNVKPMHRCEWTEQAASNLALDYRPLALAGTRCWRRRVNLEDNKIHWSKQTFRPHKHSLQVYSSFACCKICLVVKHTWSSSSGELKLWRGVYPSSNQREQRLKYGVLILYNVFFII